jgi:hypothetical protein
VIIKCIRKLRAERVRLGVKNDNATRVTRRPQTQIQIIILHEEALCCCIFGMIPSIIAMRKKLIALCKRDWGQHAENRLLGLLWSHCALWCGLSNFLYFLYQFTIHLDGSWCNTPTPTTANYIRCFDYSLQFAYISISHKITVWLLFPNLCVR